jgi:hypothetical protein
MGARFRPDRSFAIELERDSFGGKGDPSRDFSVTNDVLLKLPQNGWETSWRISLRSRPPNRAELQ